MPPPPGIAGLSFFGSSATLGLGGDEQAGDGCRALQCRAHHLGRIDDALRHHVDVLARLRVETKAASIFLEDLAPEPAVRGRLQTTASWSRAVVVSVAEKAGMISSGVSRLRAPRPACRIGSPNRPSSSRPTGSGNSAPLPARPFGLGLRCTRGSLGADGFRGDPRKKAASGEGVSTAIRHDRREAGKGRPRY